jgi:hypothetical protein
MNIKDIVGTGEIGKELVAQTIEMAKEPVADIVNPTAKTVGQRLNDIVDLIFTPVEIAKIYKDHKIEAFRCSLDDKINEIPEGKRVTPPLNVVGPALEAAKYHIEQKELREMFANLIVRSMNSDTHNIAHPSFVEIVKQLSPLDAKVIAKCKGFAMFNTIDYYVSGKGGVKVTPINNVSLELCETNDLLISSGTITNLLRLGLLEKSTTYLQYPNEKYMNDDIFAQLKRYFGFGGNITEEKAREMVGFSKYGLEASTFGKMFILACV